MTAQELKNSILQLAVQGKLVPHDASEEPASDLLKQIRIEKTKLIWDGKIKKDRSLPEISEDEIPFEIPTSWVWVRHNELFEISGGAQPDKSQFVSTPKPGYIRLYQTRDYGANPVPVYIPEHTATKRTNKGDILLARYGASLGKVFFAEDGAYNVALAKSIPLYTTDLIYKKYIYYYYQSYLYQNLVTASSRSAQAGFNKDDLIALVFPLPPLAEQKRIVEKIEELMPLIEEYGKAEEQLSKLHEEFPDKLRKSILQQAVQGKLTERDSADEPASELLKRIKAKKEILIKSRQIKKEKPLPVVTDDEKPFDIPDTWKWVRLGELFDISTGMTPLKGERKFYEGGSIPWVTSSLTSQRYIQNADTFITEYALSQTTLQLYPVHTLIIAMYGQGKTRGQISELCMPATINQACAALMQIVQEQDLNNYIYYYFLFYYDSLRRMAEGSSQPNLNLDKIRNSIVPLPPLAEQKRIVKRVEELLAMCDKLK